MSLSPETIERIVNQQELAPPGWRHLTLERQLAAADRFLALEQAKIDPLKIVEVDEVVWAAPGTPKLDKSGMPVIERRKRYARDVAEPVLHWVKQKAHVQAEYRAWLQVDPEKRAEDNDRRRFEFERAERARKFEQHEAAKTGADKYRDSRFMNVGDRD